MKYYVRHCFAVSPLYSMSRSRRLNSTMTSATDRNVHEHHLCSQRRSNYEDNDLGQTSTREYRDIQKEMQRLQQKRITSTYTPKKDYIRTSSEKISAQPNCVMLGNTHSLREVVRAGPEPQVFVEPSPAKHSTTLSLQKTVGHGTKSRQTCEKAVPAEDQFSPGLRCLADDFLNLHKYSKHKSSESKKKRRKIVMQDIRDDSERTLVAVPPETKKTLLELELMNNSI